jgi:hypothetical protein
LGGIAAATKGKIPAQVALKFLVPMARQSLQDSAVFLIDKQGKVVGFLSGLKEPDKLRAALKAAGL